MKGGYQFKTSDPYLPVETPVVGMSYHLDWAHHGCVWRLISYDEKTGVCMLRTPKSNKEIKAMKNQLRHTRQAQIRILTNKSKSSL